MYRTQYNKELKLWSGRDIPPLYNPSASIAQVVLRACVSHGPKIAQVNQSNPNEIYSSRKSFSIRAAQNLQKCGYKSGQVFSVIAKNSHNLAPIVFASLSIGCSVNTLNPSFGKTELLDMIQNIKPHLVFCDVDISGMVKNCLTELDNEAMIFTFGGSKDGSTQVDNLMIETKNEDNFVPVKVNGTNDTAAIARSSGTTGFSKGVYLSHAGLLNAVCDFEMIGSCDVILCFSSLYWLSGWLMLLGGMINGGTRIITTQPFDLEFVEKYRVTFTLNSPHHLTILLKCDRLQQADLSSIKHVAGAKCSFHVQTELSSRMPNGNVHNAYGLSEAPGVFSFNFSDRDAIGQLTNGFSVKIIDEDGKRLQISEDGEICFKGIYEFLGYYGNQKATDEVYDDEGFFLTGDIGHFDEDGNLYIVDRKKDLIKYCSFQISPSQIETYLIKLPDIKAVCVIGIPDEDNATELPAAFIVKNEKSNITKESVYNMISDHFADYCKLRGGVHFVDLIPTTSSGKFLRQKVRELALRMKS